MNEKDIQRFIDYVKIDTQSDDTSSSVPSTLKQLDLSRRLQADLKELGIESSLDEFGIVYAKLEGEEGLDVIGLNAHVDTALECSDKDVKPQIIKRYDGGVIELGHGYSMSPKEFPSLSDHIGDDLIVTSGDTLLGADDKAGDALIMAVLDYFVSHPEVKHHPIAVCFTPDEEIGRGVAKFDVKKFDATYAYTMDGGEVGELEFENFNAASATVHIQGRNVHPGYAKGKMRNAILIGMNLEMLLPPEQRPEYTEGYEGFYHLISFKGTVEECTFTYILREHDIDKHELQKATLRKCVKAINDRYGEGTATVEINHQYFNMRKQVEPHYQIVEIAMKAMEKAGVKPKVQPIRGGTDGANLSFMGLPCPNIFAGGLNFHGKMEFVPVQSMEKAYNVILNIISLYA